MEPYIADGDVMFVDDRSASISGNGTYVIAYEGHQVVRKVEDRLGEGIVLRCANPQYRDSIVPRKQFAGANPSYRVIGKVRHGLRAVATSGSEPPVTEAPLPVVGGDHRKQT